MYFLTGFMPRSGHIAHNIIWHALHLSLHQRTSHFVHFLPRFFAMQICMTIRGLALKGSSCERVAVGLGARVGTGSMPEVELRQLAAWMSFQLAQL